MLIMAPEGGDIVTETGYVDDLQVDQDLEFQRREWKLERTGWLIMGLLVLAALLGVFGSGLLSGAVAGSPNGQLQVGYQRFARQQTTSELQVRVQPGAVQEGKARIWVDAAYLESFQIERILPEPESVEVSPERLTYVFDVRNADRPMEVVFFGLPQKVGWRTGRAGLDGGQEVTFGQLIYP